MIVLNDDPWEQFACFQNCNWGLSLILQSGMEIRPGGTGGTVETRLHSFLGIFCHFQNCKAKVCRTNESKVTGNYCGSYDPLWKWCLCWLIIHIRWFLRPTPLFQIENSHVRETRNKSAISLSFLWQLLYYEKVNISNWKDFNINI